MHRGPWFDSLDPVMTRDEILGLYARVNDRYRDAVFWDNYVKLAVSRGWGTTPASVRAVLERYKPRRQPAPRDTCLEEKEVHRWCIVGGSKELITNWRMEPPAVFIGRGDHPRRGVLKRRIQPEDVVINLGTTAPVPDLPPGRSWKAVVRDPERHWLWSWEDPATGKTKYVYPSVLSKLHSERERQKFDDAVELGCIIEEIRRDYRETLAQKRAGVPELELACVLYLIDTLGLRVGNESNDRVDGATTLRVENILIAETRKTMKVTFLGKDSVWYSNTVRCEPAVSRAIKKLSEGITDKDRLFPNTSPRIVNDHLQNYHPNISAKTFRTFNATRIFEETIWKFPGGTIDDAVAWFRRCAMDVAVFCNHKKVSAIKKSREDYCTSTSVTNYIDPRVVNEWASSHRIPLGKLYSKGLVERFSWAWEEKQ